jgi:RNA polymerase sigma-70 factor (ECF subfamily)
VSALEQEFLKLINGNKAIIYKISRIYMDDPEDIADLYQEMVLQLWISYPNFKGESAFSTWMYRVCLNTALTFFKKKKKKDGIFSSFEITGMDRADSSIDSSKIELLYKAIKKLNDVEKAIIILFLEDKSHKEIGELLGISEGNARIRLHRAKDKLKEIINQYHHEF